MFHYLAKLGRKRWAKAIMPLLAIGGTSAYLSVHLYGHNIVRDLLAAHSPSGKREELSKELQSLVIKVYDDIKEDFNQPIFNVDLTRPSPTTIKWFASSSADPITLGMSESKFGILIGLPLYYNYNKPEDVPENSLEVSKIKLFKSWGREGKDTETKDEELGPSDDNIAKIRISKNSPEAQQYIESILLSENAKKFSIARELFIGDSYRPLAFAAILALSITLPIFLSRAAIQRFSFSDAHLTHRMSCYTMFGALGYFHYKILGAGAEEFFSTRAEEKAIGVNESYKEGSVEYFKKREQRNEILRNMVA